MLVVTTNKKENQIFRLWGLFPKDVEIITKRNKSISSQLEIIQQRVISVRKKLEICTSKMTQKRSLVASSIML